ncbi:unnamed protein product [Adineta steineri]|uniref:G-protein coupled receptors family 1 profile domain-containing protein n=2 Tax=Adineta steineri TaxID=433720 RepID=A0A813MZZ8_9BILA|nr:unnamed protein product [Adineta steineri]
MNSTDDTSDGITDYYTVCSLSAVFALIAVTLSCMILILVRRTKPRLHTVRHLLMCNTCIASSLYCIIQAINYTFLIFLPWETSDTGCRWRGFLSYMTLCGVTYSFLIQAISRLFICIFAVKYRWLTTFKVHYTLICTQWFFSIFFSLPSIITKDIYFRPNALCWVPLNNKIHVSYTYIAYYILPALCIFIIYIFIYYRFKKMTNNAEILIGTVNNDKRNLELLRNIVILLFIYLVGGVPTVLFLLTSYKILYLIGIVTISLTVAIEKLCTILLDRELRQTTRNLLIRGMRVIPIDNVQIARRHENLTHLRRTVIQTLPNNKNILTE